MNESAAARYQRHRRRHIAWRAGAGLAALALYAWTPAGPALAAWAAGFAGDGVVGVLLAPFLFAAFIVITWLALGAALVRLAPGRGSRRDAGGGDAAAKGSGSPLAAALASGGAAVLAGASAAWLVLAAQAVAGRGWWLAAAAVAVAAEAALLHLTPAVLARVSGARPLTRPALVERLGQLARRVRVPIAEIEEVPEGAALTSTALVAGGGEARRIFISSALLRDWPDEDVAVVVAHEIAHHAHHDMWKTLALDAAILVAACGAAAAFVPAPPPGDLAAALAALPPVALVLAVGWIAAIPARLALSRLQERRADAFALELTGSVQEFQTAIRRLASEHMAEDRPGRLARWWYHRHPTAAERIEAASRFK